MASSFNFITDKDFVPSYLCRGDFSSQHETKRDLYQIVYGILQEKMTYQDVYDLVVRISKEQSSDIVRRFKFLEIKDDIKTIISKLKKFIAKDEQLLVIIPFIGEYGTDASVILSRFNLVIFTIDSILEKGDSQMEISENPNYTYPLKDIPYLFVDYIDKVFDMVCADGDDAVLYRRKIIIDEMIRRGIYRKPRLLKQDFYHKSEYFYQPQLFYETVGYGKRMKEQAEDKNDNLPQKPKDEKTWKSTKEETGILYYMLQNILNESVERKRKKMLVSLINYHLDNDYNNDTTRSYVDKLAQSNMKDLSSRFFETVRDTLKEYRFEVPKVIEDGYTKKLQEKNR